MKVFSSTIGIKTAGNCDLIDITSGIAGELRSSGIKEGTVTIFVSGSTAGITTIEFESGLIGDFKKAMEKLFPTNIQYDHNNRWGDGNGHAHVRASVLGASLVVPISDGKMSLGTWQQIVIADFDNRSRSREIVLQIMGE
jgi:secondary thiamine-phosphate synthase enzyme